MARNREKLVRPEVEKCRLDGQTLRLATGWLRGKSRSDVDEADATALKTGRYRGNIPREIRDALFC